MIKDKQVYSKEAGGYVTGFKAMKTNIPHSIYILPDSKLLFVT